MAIWGFATDSQLLASFLGAIVVGIAYWMLGRLPVRLSVRLGATLFLGVGTVIWYASMLGTTWYLAHLVATGLMLAAIGVALGADPVATSREAAVEGEDDWYPEADEGPLLGALARPWTLIDGRQVLAGLLLGLACGARLTALFGVPLLVFVGGGGSWRRRILSTGLGLAIPLAGLVAYNVLSTGHLFSPVYEYLYRLEAGFYTLLNYNLEWAIEDPRYIPQNLGIALLGMPEVLPPCEPSAVRGWFDPALPVCDAQGCRDERAADQPGLAPGHPRDPPVRPKSDRHRGRDRGRRDRVREPHALQPGLGPVRLPLLKRPGALRSRSPGHRPRAIWRPAHPGRRTDRGVDRDQLVGRDLGRHARLVRLLPAATLSFAA